MKNNLDLPMIECEIFSCESVFETEKAISRIKSSDVFDICFVVSGEGIHKVLNHEIPCAKGDICIISPNVPHGYFLSHAGGSLTVRHIRFNLSDWFSADVTDREKRGFCYGVFNENSVIAYATLNSYMYERIYSLFDYIECEVLEGKNEWRELVKGYLSNLLIIIGRYVNSAIKSVSFGSSKEWDAVSQTISIIKSEYCNADLTLESIAKNLYLSKSQLSRFFKRITGETFSDYLHSVRMKKVLRLLRETDKNVEDSAIECGFHNMAAFYKLFRKSIGMSPKEYRLSILKADCESNEYKKLPKGEKIMSILNDISENIQKGKAKIVKELVQEALEAGVKPQDILEEGLLLGMGIVGEKFKNNEIYVPEVLVAARAMNMGAQILKPHIATVGITAKGRVCIGTVRGDLHDIGKNLVKMMLEGKGLEVIDLGTDVAPEEFIKTAIEQDCKVICCSALLTTTMPVMGEVVKAAEEAGIRDKVKIMIGGAPVSQEFCDLIGADFYTADAASAADAAVVFCKQ